MLVIAVWVIAWFIHRSNDNVWGGIAVFVAGLASIGILGQSPSWRKDQPQHREDSGRLIRSVGVILFFFLGLALLNLGVIYWQIPKWLFGLSSVFLVLWVGAMLMTPPFFGYASWIIRAAYRAALITVAMIVSVAIPFGVMFLVRKIGAAN